MRPGCVAMLGGCLLLALARAGVSQEGAVKDPPPGPPPGPSVPAPSNPVEVFIPSEKITADSSVSFPVDI